MKAVILAGGIGTPANGERLNGYIEEAYWADIGTVSDFERVDKELLSKFYTEPETKQSQ